MQSAINQLTPWLVVGIVLGMVVLGLAVYMARRTLARAETVAQDRLADAAQEAESRQTEILVQAQEKAVQMQEEVDSRLHDLEERDATLGKRQSKLDRDQGELKRNQKQHDKIKSALDRREQELEQRATEIDAKLDEAEATLQRIAGLSQEEAKQTMMERIGKQAKDDAAIAARKIEDEARESAERRATNLVIQAMERVHIEDVVESTVSFIELPSDEMKGRIIGKEGRNIRALEMATGIDLVVDDTPRSILISSFDPIRREIAKIAIERLVEDGRIHPARIEEVVEKVGEEVDDMIEERGQEAAYGLDISDLNPKLARVVGEMRFHTCHGQNLLQHCLETALIAAHLAEEVGGEVDVVRRAGLLHEIGQIDERSGVHGVHAATDLASKYGESDAVVQAIASLHPDERPRSVEALLLSTANRLSESRPGARKENLAVFIERLRRLEEIALSFDGVRKAYAVKAGKEIRVIADTDRTTDDHAYTLSKKIARALEKEVNYPGQIKVSVIRETRSVRYAV